MARESGPRRSDKSRRAVGIRRVLELFRRNTVVWVRTGRTLRAMAVPSWVGAAVRPARRRAVRGCLAYGYNQGKWAVRIVLAAEAGIDRAGHETVRAHPAPVR